jgi:hypothetical protein
VKSCIKLALIFFVGVLACSSGSSITITSVTPNHASTRGGDVITIDGSGFGTKPQVQFGTAPGTVQTAVDDSITVLTPANVEGVVDVVVTANGASARLPQAITFARYDMTFVDTSWTNMDPIAVNGAGAIAVDIDGDGHADILQAAGTEGVWIYHNDGSGGFAQTTRLPAPSATSNVVGVIAADFDGNKTIDLFLATTDGTPSALLLNDGKGNFESQTSFAAIFGTSQTAIAIDYDDDGAIDLITTGTSSIPADPTGGGIVILHNQTGTFVDVTSTALVGGSFATTGAAAADVDNDGDLDLVFGAATTPCRLYLNDGKGVFQHGSVDALPTDVLDAGVPAFGDLDGDGFTDLFIPSSGQDRVLLNDGTGRFQDVTALHLGAENANGVSAVIVDLDDDGHNDVVVVEQPGALRMYRNDGTGRLFDYSAQIVGADTSLVNAAVALADFDGDGDLDIFLSHESASRAALLTNWAPLSTTDTDSDGVPDLADSCPTIPNPTQANLDSEPFRCDSEALCKTATGCDMMLYGGSAYLVCKTLATWTAAEAACVARGAHLVTIDDANENAFVAAQGVVGFWTGGNDVAKQGTWIWTGGTSTYSNWAASQPSGTGECVQVGASGTWSASNCATPEPFVCEDLRARAPDPGDACDPCPNDYDPQDKPLTSIVDAGAEGDASQKGDAGDASTCP